MARIACVLLVLVAASPAFGADAGPDPIVAHYTGVLDQLKARPDDPTVLLSLRPPTNRSDAAQRAALDKIVAHLESAAEKSSKSFGIAHNYYEALWTRYAYYKSADDAAAAVEQLKKTTQLTKPQSNEQAQCAFELAQAVLDVSKPLAKKLFGDEQRAAAIKHFIAAKRAAMSRGPYAARSALALADLYISKADAASAKKHIREALDLDTDRGYVTNHAYDRFGLVLLAENNMEGALAMLESAGAVRPDADLKSLGYAHRLAWAFVVVGRPKEAVVYLAKIAELAEKGATTLNYDLAHTIAAAYTKLGQSDRALIYWKRYIELGDPDEGRRKRAIKTAQALAIATTKTRGK